MARKEIPWRAVCNVKAGNKGSCTPMNMSKTVKGEGSQSWGSGPGNNVNNIGNGVNAGEGIAISKVDKALRNDRQARKQANRQYHKLHGKPQVIRPLVFQGPAMNYAKPIPEVKHVPIPAPVDPRYNASWGGVTDSVLTRFRKSYR